LAQSAPTVPSRLIEQQAWLLDAGLPVLDAPCGFGGNSLFLAKRGYKVIGADIDRERIGFVASRARNEPRLLKKNLSLAVCDLNAESLPFADASYGTLLIIQFIPEQWGNYLSAIAVRAEAEAMMRITVFGEVGCRDMHARCLKSLYQGR
jgi:SAM-dependent methyltransferase